MAKNFLIMLNNQSQMVHLKLLRAIQKTPEATGDLIVNKVANKTTKNYLKIPQKQLKVKQKYLTRYISLEGTQQIVDELRLI